MAVALGLAACACAGCSGESGDRTQASNTLEIPGTILLVRDGRYLTDFEFLASGASEGEIDLGGEVVCAAVSDAPAPAAAFAVLVDGKSELRLVGLDTNEQHAVDGDILRAVGFSEAEVLYFITASTRLMSYDTETRTTHAVAEEVFDAMTDPDSDALVFVEATSDVRVDPIDTQAFYVAEPGAEPTTVAVFTGARFCGLGLVTDECVVYTENPGAGEVHGDTRVWDPATGESLSISLGSYVVCAAPQGDALLISRHVSNGDVKANDQDAPASQTEQHYRVVLDGPRFGDLQPIGEPCVSSEYGATFGCTRDQVAIVDPFTEDGQSLRYFDLLSGVEEVLYTSPAGTAISQVASVPGENGLSRFVLVVSELDESRTSRTEYAVLVDPFAENTVVAEARPASPGTLDVAGVLSPVGGG